jgi:hypothetical protein
MTLHRTTALTVGIISVSLAAWLSNGVMAQEPSASPAVPSPGASSGPGWLGANVEVYRDDFSVPSGWTIVDDESGRTAYQDGGLAMTVPEDGSTYWDDHRLQDGHAVLRVEALVSDLQGAGAAGVACGSSLGVPRYLFAAITNDADWVFGRIIDGRLQVIERAPLPGDVDASHVRLGIECASAPDEGGDHALITLDGVGVALPEFDIPVGPYDAATLLVAADVAPTSAVFDDLVVHAGGVYSPRSPERDPNTPSG